MQVQTRVKVVDDWELGGEGGMGVRMTSRCIYTAHRFMGKDDYDVSYYYDYSPLTMKQVKLTVSCSIT